MDFATSSTDTTSSGENNISQPTSQDSTSFESMMNRRKRHQELPPTDDPELDALLDDALKDFDKPNLMMKPPGKSQIKNTELMMDKVWAEEYIKQATSQFEQSMRKYLISVDGSSITQKSLEGNMGKIVDAASNAALNATTDPEALSSQLNEAIRKAAGKGKSNLNPSPESFMSGLPDENEFAKLMGGLGLGMGGDDNFDDSEMNEILPFMTNMMQKLLSKELLQPVLTEIVEKYPSWLTRNRDSLSTKDFEKYSQQYEYMKQICIEYASEKESDLADVKSKRFERISDLMLKVQYAGPPPQELIGEVEGSGNIPAFNPGGAGGEQCSIT